MRILLFTALLFLATATAKSSLLGGQESVEENDSVYQDLAKQALKQYNERSNDFYKVDSSRH